MQSIDVDAVGKHYTKGDRASRQWEALRLAGKDPEKPSVADLAAVDEFHVRGREATLELALDEHRRQGSALSRDDEPRPAGRAACHLRNHGGAPIHFPVPWARVREISALMTPEATL